MVLQERLFFAAHRLILSGNRLGLHWLGRGPLRRFFGDCGWLSLQCDFLVLVKILSQESDEVRDCGGHCWARRAGHHLSQHVGQRDVQFPRHLVLEVEQIALDLSHYIEMGSQVRILFAFLFEKQPVLVFTN